MPTLIELTEPGPLAPQVATWLIASAAESTFVDLSHLTVVTPTSASGRKLKNALADESEKLGKGLLLPQVLTPMQLLTLSENCASKLDQLIAWTQNLTSANPEDFPELLGAFVDSLDASEAFRLASSFADLASLLAEAGLRPESPEVHQVCEMEAGRWLEIAALQSLYRQLLGKADPNDEKITFASHGANPWGQIIIAAVPDLPRIVRTFLNRQNVTILAVRPPGVPAHFDEWGLPMTSFWASAPVPIPEDSISVSANPADEAREIWNQWQTDSGICTADETFKSRLVRCFEEAGQPAYDPAGISLGDTEAGKLLLAWLRFLRTGRFDDLRALMEIPRFVKWLAGEQSAISILTSFDRMIAKTLLTTLPDARVFYQNLEDKPEWLDRLQVSHSEFPPPRFREWLSALYAGETWDETRSEAMMLQAVGEVLTTMEPLWEKSPTVFSETLLLKALESQRIYPNHAADALELNGWLEALWMSEPKLIVSGCVEGCLPDLLLGHPFLPDSARARLGVSSNESRFARDVYLMNCLLAQREPHAVRVTLSRRGEQGDPQKPSRLLMRCSDEELPDRVEQLFRLPASAHHIAARELPFQLSLDITARPKALSVTDFSKYLACPLRYYLQRVCRLESVDAAPKEMDAGIFGTLMHKVLELFGREPDINHSTDEWVIRNFVQTEMEHQFTKRFGPNPSAPLKIQMESMRARLGVFASVQAGEAKAGWRIVETEKEFKQAHGNTIELSGFPLHATLDRIEQNVLTGQWRVLDYKSHEHSPESKHLANLASKPPLVEESLFDEGKKTRMWRDLQLPLYRELFEHHWPDEPSPAVGYFLLSADLSKIRVEVLDLSGERVESAANCARAIAEKIRKGRFWPAAVSPAWDDFESLFLGEDPATILNPTTIQQLEGEQ